MLLRVRRLDVFLAILALRLKVLANIVHGLMANPFVAALAGAVIVPEAAFVCGVLLNVLPAQFFVTPTTEMRALHQ
jgi:hypothetical protein